MIPSSISSCHFLVLFSGPSRQKIVLSSSFSYSSLRLEVFDSNISSLSKLNKPSYDLKLVETDFSQLVEDRVTLCRKLYENEEESTIHWQEGPETSRRNWQLDIEEGIILNIDKYYLRQVKKMYFAVLFKNKVTNNKASTF